MRFAALLVIGVVAAATAEAQTSPARVPLLPIPNKLPTLLFAPAPLAGTMLRPLTGPSPHATAFAEVEPEPAALAATGTVVADPPHVESIADTTPDTDAAAPPESVGAAPAEPPQAEAPAEEPPPPAAETPPPKPSKTKITVIVENVQTDTGVVNVAVCDKGLSREGCPYVHEIPAQQGFVETEFDDIPPGNYAIVGYHDVNGNNQFDKTMGIPREPYALSSHAADKLVPTFADAELPIKSGDNAVIIRLKRLGG